MNDTSFDNFRDAADYASALAVSLAAVVRLRRRNDDKWIVICDVEDDDDPIPF